MMKYKLAFMFYLSLDWNFFEVKWSSLDLLLQNESVCILARSDYMEQFFQACMETCVNSLFVVLYPNYVRHWMTIY